VSELRSPLQVWLEDEGVWTDVPGVVDLVLDETGPDRLNVTVLCRDFPATTQWLLDHGYDVPNPPPVPTPVERALAILAPHLATEPLYRA
jgi:hypothetical protein